MATEDDAPEMGEHDDEKNKARDPETGRGKDRDRDRARDPDEGKTAEELRAEKARMAKALKDANDEARKERLKNKEYERAEEERQAASLSEVEKIKKQAGDAERRAREAEARAQQAEAKLVEGIVDAAVEREARQQGFEYPETVARLIDRDAIEYDGETRKVSGVKDAVKKVAATYPGLIAARGGGGTPQRDNPRPRPSGGNANANPNARDPGAAERLGLTDRIDYNPL
jgi:hypothetical protein